MTQAARFIVGIGLLAAPVGAREYTLDPRPQPGSISIEKALERLPAPVLPHQTGLPTGPEADSREQKPFAETRVPGGNFGLGGPDAQPLSAAQSKAFLNPAGDLKVTILPSLAEGQNPADLKRIVIDTLAVREAGGRPVGTGITVEVELNAGRWAPGVEFDRKPLANSGVKLNVVERAGTLPRFEVTIPAALLTGLKAKEFRDFNVVTNPAAQNGRIPFKIRLDFVQPR